MIQYNSDATGLSANVENIRTKEKFLVSTAQNSLGVYETAVLRSGGLGAMIKNILKPLYVVNSSSLSQAKQTHIQTAELFEQLDTKDLIRRYKLIGVGGSQQILSKVEIKTEGTDVETKEYVKGDKVIIDGKQYIIDDVTPEDIQRDVLGNQIFESNPIQWFKNVCDFLDWSEVAKEDEDLKLVFIIILCASTVTKSIKNLYEKELKDIKLESDAGSVLFKWSNVFLESIYFYSHTLNFPNKFETELINLLANLFYYGSSDDEKIRAEKSMVNDCQARKNEYLNYKGNSTPAYLYQKAIGKSLGIINPIFTTLSSSLSLKQLSRYMDFYKAHLIGKEVNLRKIIETFIDKDLSGG